MDDWWCSDYICKTVGEVTGTLTVEAAGDEAAGETTQGLVRESWLVF